MIEEDIRWIQRFSNFERAFLLLQNSLKTEPLSILERAGLIQFFETIALFLGITRQKTSVLVIYIVRSPNINL